jgi:glycosyltransferase involved in cell wall biosynthesis
LKTLSVCMIVKDEEKNVSRCLSSISEIADEIIVVDTGSNDKTIEICKSYNTKVINHKWNNNFSEARNISLDYATKDFILFLDADEEIPKDDLIKIKNLLNEDNLAEGYFLRLVNVIKETYVGEYVVFRLFKNNKNYRFKGKIHEQIANSIQEYNKKHCTKTLDIRILHYGYDPNTTNIEDKYKRNISILKSYDEKEKDAYYYYVLGNEYSRITDYENSLYSYEKALQVMDMKYNYMFYPYLVLNIVKTYSATKQFSKSLKFIEDIKSTTPNFKDLYFMECLAYIECGKVSKALKSIDNYINCPICNIYEYPNNNFENIYDIDEMRNRLLNASIDNSNTLLSGLMILDEYDDTIIETIKSFNEIVSNFVVVTSNRDLNLDKLKSIGAQIVCTKNKDKRFNTGAKACRGKYIILVDKGEICSTLSQKQIIKLLNRSNKESFSVNLLSVLDSTYSKKVKIIKNKNISSLENHIESLIKNNMVVDSNIYIHKSNNII